MNATTGALVWNYQTPNGVESSPAVTDGIVYIGAGDGHDYAFGQLYLPVLNAVPEVPLGTIVLSTTMIVALLTYFTSPKWKRKKKS